MPAIAGLMDRVLVPMPGGRIRCHRNRTCAQSGSLTVSNLGERICITSRANR